MADILKGIGIAVSDLLGITEQKQEARKRKLEEERLKAVLENIRLQSEATRESMAAGKRTERRGIIQDLAEDLRSLPDEQLSKVGTRSDAITPGESVPTVERSAKTDSKGRPLDVVTGGTITGGPDVEAQLEQAIAGAPFAESEILEAASAKARFREAGQEKERKELIDFEAAKNATILAVNNGFYDPELGTAQVESAMEYIGTQRELDTLVKQANLKHIQASTASVYQSMEVSKLHVAKLQKELAALEEPSRAALLQNAGQDLTALAQRIQFRNPKMSQQEAYQAAVVEFVALHGDAPRVGALGILLGSQIDEAFTMIEDEEGGGAGLLGGMSIRELLSRPIDPSATDLGLSSTDELLRELGM